MAKRTGAQLTALLLKQTGVTRASDASRTSTRKPEAVDDASAALLHAWRHLPGRFAVAQRVLAELALTEQAPPKSVLVLGDAAATLCAAREVWSNAAAFDATTIEPSEARRVAAEYLLAKSGSSGRVVSRDTVLDLAKATPSPRGTFDLVVCAWGMGALEDDQRDLSLAVLWGCVAPGGALALVESSSEAPAILHARRRLLESTRDEDERERAFVVAPCAHDAACPRLAEGESPRCLFGQAVQPVASGPPLRSLRKRDAGAPLAKRASVERFSFVVLRKGLAVTAPAPAQPGVFYSSARVVDTPKKKDGHVIFDLCTSDAKLERLLLSRASLERADSSYKDARKATWGSKLVIERVAAPAEKTTRRSLAAQQTPAPVGHDRLHPQPSDSHPEVGTTGGTPTRQ